MNNTFDVIVIGGGATGMGTALDAASRGYSVLLLEEYDFGKGTSSKSTKLVHGGIRYLANLDFALVKEGLEERSYFLKNAPHIAHKQAYLVPFYSIFDKIKYFLGIKLYDFLAGKYKLAPNKFLDRNEVLAVAPELVNKNLLGGAVYYDGAFDDTRMLITMLRTLQQFGGTALNYHKVVGFIYDDLGCITGVKVLDTLNYQELVFKSTNIINATGTLCDTLMNLAEPKLPHHIITAAQGTHLVFTRDAFPTTHAIVIPKTSDDRILFVLPWHDSIIVGTTDIAVDNPSIDPKATDTEIDFILATLNNYSQKKLLRQDIQSVFCGQRPLVHPAHSKKSAKISRKHEIIDSKNGLITIVGGKWTIYRRMGQDTIDHLVKQKRLCYSKSQTTNLHLFGYTNGDNYAYPLSVYGDEAEKIKEIQRINNDYRTIHPKLPYFTAEVIYHIRYEMAKTIEDILARRTRSLFINAKASLECAPLIAEIIARELSYDEAWISSALKEFEIVAKQYFSSRIALTG